MSADFVSGERGFVAEVAHESFTLPARYYVDPGHTRARNSKDFPSFPGYTPVMSWTFLTLEAI